MLSKEKKISELLLELGIPCHVLGYQYIKQALMLILEDRKYLNLITKELYPAIAKEFSTTSNRVERAIRHAIELAFNNLNPKVIETYFKNSLDPQKDKPTNSCFLGVLAEHLKYELEKVKESNSAIYMQVTEELKPCPFCSSNDIKVDYNGFDYSISCKDCGIVIPSISKRNEVVEKWNRRCL